MLFHVKCKLLGLAASVSLHSMTDRWTKILLAVIACAVVVIAIERVARGRVDAPYIEEPCGSSFRPCRVKIDGPVKIEDLEVLSRSRDCGDSRNPCWIRVTP